MQPLNELGGSGPVIHLAPANGFPTVVYRPLIESFTDTFRVVNLPYRGSWVDDPPPQNIHEWDETTVPDLLTGMRQHNLRDVIAVGHSIGGVTSILAAIREPQRFKALVLLDPTVLPLRFLWGLRLLRLLRRDPPFAERAERRRIDFTNAEDAFAYFRGKKLFHDWSDAQLRLYVDGLVSDGNDGLTLALPREWEAYYFRTIYTRIWRDLPRLRETGIPVLLIRGSESDTLFPYAAARIRRILPEMDYHEITGHGHLFPQTAPEITRTMMWDWLRQQAVLS